ncbi:MAG: sigma-E processing peptidase SpoIIGA [Clostridium fessum]
MELVQPLGIRAVIFCSGCLPRGSFLIPSAVWRFGMQRCMKLEHQYAVTLFNKGRERHVQAILDTGNHLTMPLSGRPVQVLDACVWQRDFFPGGRCPIHPISECRKGRRRDSGISGGADGSVRSGRYAGD